MVGLLEFQPGRKAERGPQSSCLARLMQVRAGFEWDDASMKMAKSS